MNFSLSLAFLPAQPLSFLRDYDDERRERDREWSFRLKSGCPRKKRTRIEAGLICQEARAVRQIPICGRCSKLNLCDRFNEEDGEGKRERENDAYALFCSCLSLSLSFISSTSVCIIYKYPLLFTRIFILKGDKDEGIRALFAREMRLTKPSGNLHLTTENAVTPFLTSSSV